MFLDGQLSTESSPISWTLLHQLSKIAFRVVNPETKNTEMGVLGQTTDLIQDENEPVIPREGLEGRQQDGG
jgi:hypothetical protein